MPRTLPSGINTNYTQPGSQPGYLVRIFLAAVTLRFTTLDTDYTLAGDLYTSTDVQVPDISFDGTVTPGAQLQFGDMDIIFWTAAMQRLFNDARVEIDAIYSAAANQSVPLFSGRCSGPSRSVSADGAVFSLPLDAEVNLKYAPRERVQDTIDQRWLLAAGDILTVNGQKWIIDRPNTSRN
jgi:hypothetical protein